MTAMSEANEAPNLKLLHSLVATLNSKVKKLKSATYAELPEVESEALMIFRQINMITGQAELEVGRIADARRQEVK